MKKIFAVFLLSIIMGCRISGQIMWMSDFDQASKVALKTGKLLLLDFWAVWCGPCKNMDTQLWMKDEMSAYAKNFIAVRINVDYDKRTPMKYHVQSIPTIMLITAGGEQIWGQVGFYGAGSLMNLFKSLPSDVSALNNATNGIEEKRKDFEANFLAGQEFQKASVNITNADLRDSFLECSKKFFYRAEKLTTDPVRSEETKLNILLDQVYAGSYKYVLKSLDKHTSQSNEQLMELRHYILAECYKRDNDDINFMKEKGFLKNKIYLGLLEK